MQANTKKCQYCGDAIKGRPDKKFCSDQCRNAHNNQLNRDANNYVRNVNNILRKNRRILAKLCKGPSGKSKVHRDRLVESGFKFQYMTNVYKTKAGKVYYFCYEYGYLSLENDFFAVVFRESYVE